MSQATESSYIELYIKISIQVVTVIRYGYSDAFNSKKRDLSNNSNTEEDAKRQREESPHASLLDTPKNNNQIKGETQLADLSELIKFMPNKFHEFESRGKNRKR